MLAKCLTNEVAFYLAGEITQVLDAIPWVRCASGNVFLQKPTSPVFPLIAAVRWNTAALNFIPHPLFLKLITLLSLSLSFHSQPRRIIWEMNFDFWEQTEHNFWTSQQSLWLAPEGKLQQMFHFELKQIAIERSASKPWSYSVAHQYIMRISESAASVHQLHQCISSISASAASALQKHQHISTFTASMYQQQQHISGNSASAASALQ